MRRRTKGKADLREPSALLRGRIPMASLIQTLAVAEYLSFQRAARALGTSQSSVSAHIKALEQDLGVILFARNTRGVRVTEAGRRFVDQVVDAMGILDRAIKTAGMQARGEEGELRIGVQPSRRAATSTDCWSGSMPNILASICTSPRARRAMGNSWCAKAGSIWPSWPAPMKSPISIPA